MEVSIRCHKCKRIIPELQLLKCTRNNCDCYFCLDCFSEKFKSDSIKWFSNYKKNNKFICFKCLNVCTCDNCMSNYIIKPNLSFLSKKRKRYSKKIHYHDKHLIKQSKSLLSKKSENQYRIDSNDSVYDNLFPNYSQNGLLNAIILNSATITHAFRLGRPKKKSNKPCILCNKFNCPPGVEIIKYKSYDDYLNFLYTFFSQIESEQKRGEVSYRLSEDLYHRILLQKKNLQQLKDYFKKSMPKTNNKLKGPKRFCSNCIANLFREQNGVYSIYESLKDDDEQASLEPKKKLEIIKGLHLLIEKEKSNVANLSSNQAKEINEKQIIDPSVYSSGYKEDNIFNQILGEGKENTEKNRICDYSNMGQFTSIPNTNKNEITYNCNYNYNYNPKFYFDFNQYRFPQQNLYQFESFIPSYLRRNNMNSNLCQTFITKINDYADESKRILYELEHKLIDYALDLNNLSRAKEVQSLTEVLSNRTKLLNKAMNDYGYVLHNIKE